MENLKSNFCLNCGYSKFIEQYDSSNSVRLAKTAIEDYSMELYTVKNKKTGEKCAAKEIVCSKEKFIKRVWKEMKSIITIMDHENEHVIKYYEAFLYDSMNKFNEKQQGLIIIMELGDSTLYDKINQGLEEVDALEKLKQCILGLEFLKKNNIYHRDIKPQNIVIKNNKVKIIDFDISKFSQLDKTQKITDKFGTQLYMDPRLKFLEENENDQTLSYNLEKADLYSLGLTFLQLCRKMDQDSFINLKKKLDQCYLEQNVCLYDNLINQEISKIKDQDLSFILETLLEYDIKMRSNLNECLAYLFPLFITIPDEETYEKKMQWLEQQKLLKEQYQYKYRAIIFKGNTEIQAFLNAFQTASQIYKNIQRIIFEFTSLKLIPVQIEQLFHHIQNFDNLKSLRLNLQNNQMGSEGAKQIGNSLQKLKSLDQIYLNLKNNNIQDKGAVNIGQSLRNHISLRFLYLFLDSNQISDTGMIEIWDSISNLQFIESLIISVTDNQVGNLSLQRMKEGLINLSKIGQLIIDFQQNTDVTGHGIDEIRKVLEKIPELKHLTLGIDYVQGNKISFSKLGKMLRNLQQLKSLELLLYNPSIEVQKSDYLVSILRPLNFLRELYLSFNYDIGEKQFIQLTEALKEFIYLYTLQISITASEIGNKGAEKVGQLIKSLPSLTHLTLQFSNFNVTPDLANKFKQSILNLNIPKCELNF